MVPVEQRRRRRWFDLSAFRSDIRAAAYDATAALVITLLIFAWFYRRIDAGTSATLQVMPFLADAGLYWMYWMCQAFGWSALLWAWITVLLGLLRTTRGAAGLPVSAMRIEKWRRTTSLTTIALMFAHAFWFFAELVRENEAGLGPAGRVWSAFIDVFVPGGYSSGTGQIAILIGLLALYLAIPLGLAFYARRSIGAKVWRVLHASVIVVYVLSVWHTLLYGTNVWFDGWFRTTIWLLQLPVAALLLLRLVTPAHPPRPRPLDALGRLAGRGAAAATIVVLLLVAASGRDGGRTPGAEGAGLNVTQPMIWAGLAAFIVAVTILVIREHRLASVRQTTAGRRAPQTPQTGDE
ncbi:ferric reductase-like transmembrane domain-containing protein [Phytoactinopolyspora halotolerans]|uniref:Iron reductase n=1 Tax=Phytoactinopolyspora halotolerans TaxID=1981512 RepID=A0A6L9SJZ2_9ACTN|nr:ferric reductase-like transmembrane domain-containing protein [Phytoactinopolyspora halotolerans]NEE04390.1 iron reductase [Phytoactinopolyspora halotolerans]